MSANESLAERIQQRFGSLPAKQQSVARVLAGHPSTVALSSLSDIAAQAGVDAATVVRTCQTLDYSGWRDLLASLKQDLSRERTFAERVAALGSQDGDLTALIHANARRNVDDTFETLNEQVLEDVARCSSHADTTLVVAVSSVTWQRNLKDLCGQMVFKLNAALGAPLVTFVELRVDDGFVRATRLSSQVREEELRAQAENEISPELRSAADKIADEELRKQFLLAAGNCLVRKRSIESRL